MGDTSPSSDPRVDEETKESLKASEKGFSPSSERRKVVSSGKLENKEGASDIPNGTLSRKRSDSMKEKTQSEGEVTTRRSRQSQDIERTDSDLAAEKRKPEGRDSPPAPKKRRTRAGRKKGGKPFSTLQAKWDEMFDRLVAYKNENGNCLVPNRYEKDSSLGAWVSTQRRQYKILTSGSSESTPMTPQRAQRLNSIGFVWATKDPRHTPWETRFDQLRQFWLDHGHCLVPIGYKENVQLANWVSTQRQEYKCLREGRPSRLTPQRIQLLESVGFVWDAQRGGNRKLGRYKPMVEYMTPKPRTDSGNPANKLGSPQRERKMLVDARATSGADTIYNTGSGTRPSNLAAQGADRADRASPPHGAALLGRGSSIGNHGTNPNFLPVLAGLHGHRAVGYSDLDRLRVTGGLEQSPRSDLTAASQLRLSLGIFSNSYPKGFLPPASLAATARAAAASRSVSSGGLSAGDRSSVSSASAHRGSDSPTELDSEGRPRTAEAFVSARSLPGAWQHPGLILVDTASPSGHDASSMPAAQLPPSFAGAAGQSLAALAGIGQQTTTQVAIDVALQQQQQRLQLAEALYSPTRSLIPHAAWPVASVMGHGLQGRYSLANVPFTTLTQRHPSLQVPEVHQGADVVVQMEADRLPGVHRAPRTNPEDNLGQLPQGAGYPPGPGGFAQAPGTAEEPDEQSLSREGPKAPGQYGSLTLGSTTATVGKQAGALQGYEDHSRNATSPSQHQVADGGGARGQGAVAFGSPKPEVPPVNSLLGAGRQTSHGKGATSRERVPADIFADAD